MPNSTTDRPRIGVGGVITDGAGRVVLIQRGKAPGRGLWAFPGGSLEWGESLRQGAEREIGEECGIQVQAGPLLYVTELLDPAFHFVVLDYACRWDGGALRAGGDAARASWVEKAAAQTLPLTGGMRECLQDPGVRDFLGWA